MVVGAVVSATGAQAQAAEGYRRALLLWEGEVKGRGGLLGRQVEVRLRDDASQAVRAGREYEELLKEADLLIGPYGSAATLMATSVTERARRVMINGAGPARTVHRRLPRYLFQSATPYAAYGAGVLELSTNEGLKSLVIVARDDPRARDMAEATAEMARKSGFAVSEATYGGGLTDFAPQVALARKSKAQAWIAFGEARDAVDMVRTFKRVGYAPPLFFARGASEAGFVTGLGQDAEFSLGALHYDSRLKTAGNAAFAKAYAARWNDKPDAAAAEGYAAATVLEAAVRAAGTLDQEKLRAVLARLEVATVLGTYKVDPASGTQVGHVPAVTQIRKGEPEPVWPRALETANALLPYPQWAERSPIR